MFQEIPKPMDKIMRELEAQDRRNHKLSKQVPRDVGRLLAILAASAGNGNWLELGTSCGYSAMWLALACRARCTRLVTVDHDPEKVGIATQNLERAGVQDIVRVVHGDSLEELQRFDSLDFCFVDADGGKGTYETLVPKMNPGGLFIYDHTNGRGAEIIEAALADTRVDAVLVPLQTPDARTELIVRRCS